MQSSNSYARSDNIYDSKFNDRQKSLTFLEERVEIRTQRKSDKVITS